MWSNPSKNPKVNKGVTKERINLSVDKNLYDLPPKKLKNIPSTPGSLSKALNALEKDHDFLLQGDVFTKDVIETYINYKKENEIDAINLRPHPYELHLYYDA